MTYDGEHASMLLHDHGNIVTERGAYWLWYWVERWNPWDALWLQGVETGVQEYAQEPDWGSER